MNHRSTFLRYGCGVVNLDSVEAVEAGGHRKAETCFLITWKCAQQATQFATGKPIDSRDSISGEDAEVFALDFWRATGRDLFVICKVGKPGWVAREMEGMTASDTEDRPILLTPDFGPGIQGADLLKFVADLSAYRDDEGHVSGEADSAFADDLRRSLDLTAWRDGCNTIAG